MATNQQVTAEHEQEFETPLAEQESSSGYGGWIALLALLSIVGIALWLLMSDDD